jgi:hypothetical protein
MTKKLTSQSDFILILCPEINPEDKGKFSDFKHGLYLGGEIRMAAAYELYKQNKKVILTIVADYYPDNENLSHWSRADEMKSYLLHRGVPEKNIKIINSLPCTRHNLVAVFNSWSEIFKNKKVALLTNSYHLPRSLVFWLELKKIKKYQNIPSFPILISAENVVNNKVRYKNPAMYIARLESELKGIMDCVSENYNDACFILSGAKKEKLIVRKDYQKTAAKNKKYLLTPEEINSSR